MIIHKGCGGSIVIECLTDVNATTIYKCLLCGKSKTISNEESIEEVEL